MPFFNLLLSFEEITHISLISSYSDITHTEIHPRRRRTSKDGTPKTQTAGFGIMPRLTVKLAFNFPPADSVQTVYVNIIVRSIICHGIRLTVDGVFDPWFGSPVFHPSPHRRCSSHQRLRRRVPPFGGFLSVQTCRFGKPHLPDDY